MRIGVESMLPTPAVDRSQARCKSVLSYLLSARPSKPASQYQVASPMTIPEASDPSSAGDSLSSFVRSGRDGGSAKIESVCKECSQKLTAYTVELLEQKQRNHRCPNAQVESNSSGT